LLIITLPQALIMMTTSCDAADCQRTAAVLSVSLVQSAATLYQTV